MNNSIHFAAFTNTWYVSYTFLGNYASRILVMEKIKLGDIVKGGLRSYLENFFALKTFFSLRVNAYLVWFWWNWIKLIQCFSQCLKERLSETVYYAFRADKYRNYDWQLYVKFYLSKQYASSISVSLNV